MVRYSGLSNIFKEKNNKTVLETLESRRYLGLRNEVIKRYSRYLDVPLGKFLYFLKQNNDPFYRRFLNPYGDETYSKFGIQGLNNSKGVYTFLLSSKVAYIGRSHDTFNKRINVGYGNISPKNCYLDGQATNCHINSLITKNWPLVSFYVHPIDDENLIDYVEKELIRTFKPDWNLVLKD